MPRGRPPSLDRAVILERLATAPATGLSVSALSRELGLERGRCADAMDRLVAGEHAVLVGRVALPGIRKPVCHYALPPMEESLPSIFDLLQRGLRAKDGV